MLLDYGDSWLMGKLGTAATVPTIRCSCNYAGSFISAFRSAKRFAIDV